MASVFLGMFAVEVLAQRGLFTKLGVPFAFLTRAANLPIQLSSTLTAALLDSRAGHSILSSLYKEGRIGDRHVISFVLLSTPLVGTRLFVQFSLPSSLALLGVELTLVSFLLSLTSWLVAVAYPAKLVSKISMFLVLYHALSIPLQLAIIQLLPLGS